MIRRPRDRAAVVRWAAIAAALAVAVALPYVATSYYVSLVTLALVAAILGSSINLLAGNAGLVSLGHAGIAASAGYGLAWSSRQGWEVPAQLALAAGLTLASSVVFGLISMRMRGIFFLMVTLAAGMIVYGITYRWSSITGGTNGLTGIRRPPLFAEYWQFYFVALLSLVIVTVGLVVLGRSPFGLTLRGIRESESRMVSLGYNVPAYKFAAMLLSGAVAGVAGVLAVWQNEFISPAAAGFQESALTMVMVVLGGIGTVFGPLVGAVLVTFFENVLSSSFDRWPTLLGVLFIASVILAPQGIVGGVTALVGRIRARRSATEPPATPSPLDDPEGP
ncbi:branched-chain amino acid ABC transporter permease [soil metagenome]